MNWYKRNFNKHFLKISELNWKKTYLKLLEELGRPPAPEEVQRRMVEDSIGKIEERKTRPEPVIIS